MRSFVTLFTVSETSPIDVCLAMFSEPLACQEPFNTLPKLPTDAEAGR